MPDIRPTTVRYAVRYEDDSGEALAVVFENGELWLQGCGGRTCISVASQHARWLLRALEATLPLVEDGHGGAHG